MEQKIIPYITIDQVSLLILSDDYVLLNIHTLQNTNPMLQCLYLIIKCLIFAESVVGPEISPEILHIDGEFLFHTLQQLV